ncbi:MAG: thioredoxin [bacterium]|nr:thioredoxin [bacterium]
MTELTDTNFDQEVLKSDIPVFVEFGAPWCGPCQMAEPVIEELAKEYEGKVKICELNVDQNQLAAQKFGVMSIPTVITFKGGQEVKRQVGFPGKEGYLKLLQEVLEK